MDLISYSLAKKAINLIDGEELKVKSMEVVDGALMVTLSSGKIINAGQVPASDSEKLKQLEEKIEEIKETSISSEGGTLTGNLILPEDPTEELQAATKQYVDNKIVSESSLDDFPTSGTPNVIYISENENKIYHWNQSSQSYEALSSSGSGDIENIRIINGGNSNARK